MELKVYLAILWRRKWVIAVTATVTVIVVVIGTLLTTPAYAASTILRVLTAKVGSGDWVGYDLSYADRLMNTYLKIATSSPMRAALMERFKLDKPPQIEVEILANTELIQITIEGQNPILATEMTNALAEMLIAQGKRDREIRGNTLSIVEPAVVPLKPSKPHKALNMALGLMVGLAGGMGLAFLFENLDTTLYTTEQIEATTEVATLGKIPTVKRKRRSQITFMNGNSPQGEAFRRLRTNIFTPNPEALVRTLLITSAEPGEGKSTVVANLALTIAQLGRKVIVVDGDLRLPTLHKIFDLSNEIGLSNILKQEATLAEAVQDSNISGIQVLTSGPLPSNPAELLGSSHMIALIEQLEQQFDLVLLDTPASLAVTDVAVLAPVVDAVVLVVGQAQVRREAVQAACQQLAAVKARPIGVVVNRVKQEGSYDYYYRKRAQCETGDETFQTRT